MRQRSGSRVLAAILFTDIVDSSAVASRVGDARWKELIARHHAIVRRELKRFGGRELDTAGDGFYASFGEPAAAIRCACAASEAVRELGIEIRAGVHFGECEQLKEKLGGIAVVVGARVMSLGGAGDVLVTASTSDLVAGAGFRFQDRGNHSLKGVEGQWHVLAVTEVDGHPRALPAEPEVAEQRLADVQPSGLRRRSRLTRPWPVGVAIVLVTALIAISVPLLRSTKDAVDIGTNSVGRLNAERESLDWATPLGQRPSASVIGFGSLWIVEPDQGVVIRLDLEHGTIIDTIGVGSSPSGVAVGNGSIWVTNAGDGTVSRISQDPREVPQVLPDVGSQPTGIAFGDGALWVADSIGAQLLRVDPATGESRSVRLAGQPSGVAFTPDGVWVSIAPAGVARVDPTDLSVTFGYQPVGNGPTAVLPAFGSIWVANYLDGTVSRLEPSTGREEAKIPVKDGPTALAAAAGSLWVANEFDGSITAINPATSTTHRTVPVGGAPVSLATDGANLWLAVGASSAEHRGGTMTVSSATAAPYTLDPAFWDPQADVGPILSLTNDGLLAYKKVGGPDGDTLVPDLASALPQVSADGLTYRFPLRQGIRYSTGELVQPDDFRFAVERSISLNREAASQFSALDGAKACSGDPSTCDMTDSIEVDKEAVTFHLARPDPDLPYKLALPWAFPLPVSTLVADLGFFPVPATGPYKIEKAGVDGIELVRNGGFHEWSAAAQPDGFVDAISWRFDEEPASAFRRLDAGQLDWMTEEPPPQELASLRARHPGQVMLQPQNFLIYVGTDIHRPPFNDVRVRQALNYAINRNRIADLMGSTSLTPTCQILPSNFQGYEPFCPYTLEPGSGVWSAPDHDRAHSLIAEAGAVGKKVTVWALDDPRGNLLTPAIRVATMRYIVKVLNDLGLRAELKVVHSIGEYRRGVTAGEAQAYLWGWNQLYPRAGDYIGGAFRCRSLDNVARFCSKSVDAAINTAVRLQTTDPAASNRLWTEIEHRLVKEAVWTPLANLAYTNVFSARTENIQLHPVWGVLLSRLWVQ
jgi:peptide/nickel transport system substrate-binding protein